MEDLNLQNAQMPKIDIKKYPTYKCHKCGGQLFEHACILKEISGLELGMGTESFAYPLDVLVCKSCGEILKDHQEELGLSEKEEKKDSTLIL